MPPLLLRWDRRGRDGERAVGVKERVSEESRGEEEEIRREGLSGFGVLLFSQTRSQDRIIIGVMCTCTHMCKCLPVSLLISQTSHQSHWFGWMCVPAYRGVFYK